ncbi:MAG: hypothetical protein AAF547_02570 [Actinomycetota bacterium]
MSKLISSIVLGGFAALVVAIVFALGIVSIQGPSFPSFSSVDMEVTVPNEARITSVEPISLDCRARVHAEVPVEGEREHEAFGLVYRTDRISLHAYGDVDTCVDGDGASVTHHDDGSTEVVIDADSIVFVRPRVDTVRTASSVDVDKDAVGKIIDAFPWVDDNLGLTPLAYAYAQNVIGSSRCMTTAYALAEGLLIDAYREQVVDQGVDPDLVTVTIDGEPTFHDPKPIDLGDLDLRVGIGDITCTASDDLDGVRVSSGL